MTEKNSKVKDGKFITVASFMIKELNLKGNDLLVYAIIYGFSQTDGMKGFSGSLQYLADWTNSTKRGIIKNLESLIQRGYIAKEVMVINGIKYCTYTTVDLEQLSNEHSSIVVNSVHGGSEHSSMGVVNKVHGGSELSSHNNIEYNIDNNIPKVLYGDDDNIKQTFTYLVEFINNYFNRYDLTINISKISVRNNCKLMFSIIVNYKNTKLDFIERDNKCIIETNAWEYELYNRLVELQKGTYEVKKDNSSLIFNFALFQKIKDNNEAVEEEIIKYNNYSGKKILIALDNHLDINKFTELLVNYNVDISTSSSIEELTELLRSDKTFDIVFLSNTISGIENYNIITSEERKRTMTKLSLIAGYKLQIIMVTLEDYKDSDTEYIKMPISKVKLDDIMVKYLN